MSQTKAQLLEGNSSQSLSLSSAAVAVGSAGSPSITFTGDLNTGIYSPGADQVAISTGGTGRLAIDASGNINMDSGTVYVDATNNRLGIGSTAPTAKLEVVTDGITKAGIFTGNGINVKHPTLASNVFIGTNDGADGKIGTINNSPFFFITNDTERARIDTSGRLLVGTTTADTSGNALLQVNGSIKGTITSGTAVASTSGTAIDFTGIPSWVKRITVLIADVSTNSGNACLIQFGSSGTIQTTNYKARNNYIGGNNLTSTSGFPWGVNGGAGTNTFRGSFMCNLVDASTNVWIVSGAVDVQDGNGGTALTQGRVTLSGTLNILRLQAGTIGTETFDAGTVNIIYEG